jgi:hypothetical protein
LDAKSHEEEQPSAAAVPITQLLGYHIQSLKGFVWFKAQKKILQKRFQHYGRGVLVFSE